MIRRVTATRYVTPLREGGSLPAIVEADDDGLYVAKFRGAGHEPECDAAEIRAQLEAIVRVAEGSADAGPIARLSQSERFHWISSPHSTIVQRSEAHTGLTDDPAATLEHLFRALVLAPLST